MEDGIHPDADSDSISEQLKAKLFNYFIVKSYWSKDERMQECVLHVLRPSLKFLAARTARAVAALQVPLHIFWRTLSWNKTKQEYQYLL